MKKCIVISVVFLLYGLSISLPIMAQSPDWTRLLQLNSNSASTVTMVTADADNVYMVGRMSGPVTFEDIHYTSTGLNDMFLVKMSNAGVIQWVKQFDAQFGGSIIPNALKVDQSGNVYVAATFFGTITVGDETINSDLSNNSFFIMFDGTGNSVWATPFFSTGGGSSKIAIDTNGNSYLLSKTSRLLKFNDSGIIQWEQGFANRTLQAIAVDGSNLYLGGGLQDEVTYFGTLELRKLGGYNTGYLVKANLDGEYLKGIVVGGSTMDDGSVVSDMVADNSGNLFITGLYTMNLELGAIILENTGPSYYTYIAKCDDNLDFEWAKSSEGFANPDRETFSYRIFVDDSNNIYEFGMVNSSITFGTVELTPTPGNQFLFKFDPNGNTLNGYVYHNLSYDRTFVNSSGKVLAGCNSEGNFSITQYNDPMEQDWQKSSIGGISGTASINNIQHDSAGNTYLQSRIRGYCDYFGTIINTINSVTVLSKHDKEGKLLWIHQIADISPKLFGPVFILDKDNNVLTIGLFRTSLEIGNTTLNSTNSSDEAYVAKYSSSGEFLWASQLNLNTNVSTINTIAADNAGNVLVSGVIYPANYLLKFDASGNQLWAKTFPMESKYTTMISTDAHNNIYLTSEIHLSEGSGSTTIGTIPLTQTSNDGSTALVKFDPNGNALWAKTYGGVPGLGYSDGWACDIKTDSAGNTYLWGWCVNNAVFGPFTLTNPIGTGYSLYLAKIDPLGDVIWVNAVYETKVGFNYGDLLDLDMNGNVYVGGHFTDLIRIEGAEYFPEGTNDFFAVKYSSTGDFQWIKTIPANTIIINALSIKDNDVLSVAGYAGIYPTLGNFNIVRMSGSNCIVATLGDLTTGTKELHHSHLSVFPNPVRTTLYISGLTPNAIVSVYDLGGKLLINKSVMANQIDVSKLANGFYTLRIVDKNRITTRKIIKQ